ncbi:hypothetical protein GOODEAATRI_017754 [Goodea atripinnis]|uniref:Uncharacterized protein n=1 Tax=Goodea atripinnis TaxID=208336 RepID=A0ABV0PZ02_9TELE
MEVPARVFNLVHLQVCACEPTDQQAHEIFSRPPSPLGATDFVCSPSPHSVISPMLDSCCHPSVPIQPYVVFLLFSGIPCIISPSSQILTQSFLFLLLCTPSSSISSCHLSRPRVRLFAVSTAELARPPPLAPSLDPEGNNTVAVCCRSFSQIKELKLKLAGRKKKEKKIHIKKGEKLGSFCIILSHPAERAVRLCSLHICISGCGTIYILCPNSCSVPTLPLVEDTAGTKWSANM